MPTLFRDSDFQVLRVVKELLKSSLERLKIVGVDRKQIAISFVVLLKHLPYPTLITRSAPNLFDILFDFHVS